MGFNYQAAHDEAAQEAATAKWDKARLHGEKVVFCIGAWEEIENPWFKKDTDPATVFQLSLRFLDKDRQTHTIRTTYKVTPELRIMFGKYPMPWHNFTFTRYQTKLGSYGYELSQRSTDDSTCPWESYWAATRSAKGATPAEGTPEADSGDVDAILQEMGFDGLDATQTLATEQQKSALLKGAAALKTMGLAFDPGDVDVLTEYQAEQKIILMNMQLQERRRAWMQQSAASGHKSDVQ